MHQTIETNMTHTVTLEWPYKMQLSKRDFMDELTRAFPRDALIVGLSIADVPRNTPNQSFPEVMRTLTITYRDDPLLSRYRRL